MRALVTGSAGFIGRHFVTRLHADGYEIFGCDPEHPRGDYWRGDCRTVFRSETPKFDLVVHCAATIPAVDKQLENGLSVAQDFELDAAAQSEFDAADDPRRPYRAWEGKQ